MPSNLSPTIAGTMSQARTDMIDHLRGAGATAEGDAVTLQPQRHSERRALSFLTGRGIVRLTGEGRYWLDEEAEAAWRRESRTRTGLMILGAAAAVAGGIALLRYRQTRE